MMAELCHRPQQQSKLSHERDVRLYETLIGSVSLASKYTAAQDFKS